MELGSDFSKEPVTLHVFCHVQRTECEATVMMGGGNSIAETCSHAQVGNGVDSRGAGVSGINAKRVITLHL